MKDYNSIVSKASLGLSEVSDMLKDRQFENSLNTKRRGKISKVGELAGAALELKNMQKKEYKTFTNNKKLTDLLDFPTRQGYYDNNEKITLKGTDVSIDIKQMNEFLLLDHLYQGKADFGSMFKNAQLTE